MTGDGDGDLTRGEAIRRGVGIVDGAERDLDTFWHASRSRGRQQEIAEYRAKWKWDGNGSEIVVIRPLKAKNRVIEMICEGICAMEDW